MTESLINLRAEILVAIEVQGRYIGDIGPGGNRFDMEEFQEAIGEMERLSRLLDETNLQITIYKEALVAAKKAADFKAVNFRNRFEQYSD